MDDAPRNGLRPEDVLLQFTEESNALDYLVRTAAFLEEALETRDSLKWATIALHGALHGFGVCAAKGTRFRRLTKNQEGERLLSIWDVLRKCEDPGWMSMTMASRHLVLADEQRSAIHFLVSSIRNQFEHYVPRFWSIEIPSLLWAVGHVLDVVEFLALETGNYTMLEPDEIDQARDALRRGRNTLGLLWQTYLAE